MATCVCCPVSSEFTGERTRLARKAGGPAWQGSRRGLYTLHHVANKDQTEKEWTTVANPAAGPAAQPAKATTPPATAQCKDGASAEELRECERAKQSEPPGR
jgi:hypothetical protein